MCPGLVSRIWAEVVAWWRWYSGTDINLTPVCLSFRAVAKEKEETRGYLSQVCAALTRDLFFPEFIYDEFP